MNERKIQNLPWNMLNRNFGIASISRKTENVTTTPDIVYRCQLPRDFGIIAVWKASIMTCFLGRGYNYERDFRGKWRVDKKQDNGVTMERASTKQK